MYQHTCPKCGTVSPVTTRRLEMSLHCDKCGTPMDLTAKDIDQVAHRALAWESGIAIVIAMLVVLAGWWALKGN